MIEHWLHLLIFASAIGSGLTAGLFFAFSSFVMTALARLSSSQGIAAMQHINVTVLNPLFGLVFFGTTLTSVILAITSILGLGEAGGMYLLAGSLLYIVGSFIVTIVFNVPLNDQLAEVKPDSAEAAALWTHYTAKWTAWNHVRTVSALASLGAFIIVLWQ